MARFCFASATRYLRFSSNVRNRSISRRERIDRLGDVVAHTTALYRTSDRKGRPLVRLTKGIYLIHTGTNGTDYALRMADGTRAK